ncbi:serine/threonine-protein kinase [Adlercreutzia murintestinalis]|uniref:serine/threonine-protein kinase n=1 Tax=Adlercreutzia murintestinalis TaxID=2941325 RepID=UPI00203F1AE2|nr:serine/threonine-protein kinase [Adlercreutzia murintestinalis]
MPTQQIILDRYRVIAAAGRGGYATVLHAYDTLLKRDVAIKEIQLSASDIQKAQQKAAEAAAVRPDAILPDGLAVEDDAELPELPSFLDKRDERRQRRGRQRSGANEAARTRSGGRIAANTQDIAGIAGDLPGLISGAGTVQIDAVDGQGVQLDHDDLIPLEERSTDTSGGLPVMSAASDGRSTVLPVFGRGTSGHKARDPRTATRAASQAASLDPAFYDNIPGLKEARSAAHLNDPNIVTVYDCVVDGSSVYVIMEYVQGKTLARIMDDLKNDITLDMVAAVFDAVTHALEVAHAANLLHLDVKPENVIVSTKGAIKVTDFGLSTLMDASGRGTTGGGTIGYMPLEQMRREALDVRTDEWALASLTYEMLSGKNPFRAHTLREAEGAIENAELVLPSQCWASIDEDVDDVIFQALDPDMDERFGSISQFARELAPLLGDAKAGKKQLAKVVEGEQRADEAHEERAARAAAQPGTPLIDRLGQRGAAIAMRVLAAASSAMVGAISLLNIRLNVSDMFGLLSGMPAAFWVLLAAFVGLSAWRPRVGMPVTFAAFCVMLMCNQAWALGLILLALTGVWWWFFGRRSDGACTVVMLQPLFGSVGFAAIAPVGAAVVLDVREALAASGMAVASAIAFAALGTGDVAMWDITTCAMTAANAELAGVTITQTLLLTLQNAATWLVGVSWVAAAGLFSLFCRRGTKLFDVLGGLIAAACIIGGCVSTVFLIDAPLLVFNLIAAVVCGGMAVAVAFMNVPDRVRLEEGEW